MRKIITLLLLGIALTVADVTAGLAQKPVTEISTVKQKGETVRFTLSSSRPFIFGNNRYVLHVAGKEFYRTEQTRHGGKGYLTFLISSEDFKNLPNGVPMYLTYGHVSADDDMDALAAKSRRCWSLGKFNQSLLTK